MNETLHYNMGGITSPITQWHDIIADPTLGDAILDRIVHNAHRIQLKATACADAPGKGKRPEPTMSPPRARRRCYGAMRAGEQRHPPHRSQDACNRQAPTNRACRRARACQDQALKGGHEDAASLDRSCARQL
jgi:hypothetical protein